MNYTLDIQWQPRNDLAIEVGYVGNLGRHQVIPGALQSAGYRIAHQARVSPVVHTQQKYSYGYNVGGANP